MHATTQLDQHQSSWPSYTCTLHIISRRQQAHEKLVGYLEQAIWNGELPPQLGAGSGTPDSCALWRIMIDCLTPIAKEVRPRAYAHATAGHLPPVPLAAPQVPAPQVGQQQAQTPPPGPPQFPAVPMQQPMPPMLQMPAYNPYGGYYGQAALLQQQQQAAAAQAAYHNYYTQQQGHAHGQGSPASRAAL